MTSGQLAVVGVGLGGLGVWLWARSRAQALPVTDYGTGLTYEAPGPAVTLRMTAPVSGPVPSGAGSQGQTIHLGPLGPSTGDVLSRAGIGVATGIGIAAVGPGSIGTAAFTAGIGAGVSLLTWAIATKGLFRGGEVGVVINPLRDKFIGMWGPEGTGPESGFGRLAAELTQITGEPNGSHYFTDLIGATEKDQLINATMAIRAVYARVGVNVPAYAP